MNCVPGLQSPNRRWLTLSCLLVLSACGFSESESADRRDEPEYDVHYTLTLNPANASVAVSMRLRQPRNLLREVSFAIDARISDVRGDGTVQLEDDRISWRPPPRGGTLEWNAEVRHLRGDQMYDALLGPDWGVFRAEDVIPRVRSRSIKGAWSNTTMAFELPARWSAVTEYSSLDNPIRVRRGERRFDQPTGWIAVGVLGVRRDTIAGVRVAIAAPEGQGVRRLEMLALLNWTLPELMEILPDSLSRLTVVTAGAPMWRGGLSAPSSLFLHADRPLISENATSPLLHEVMHAALSVRADDGYDWIVEGLAEFYSIELLRRGKAISSRRAERAFAQQAEWAGDAETLCSSASKAATTALAVTVFRSLDQQLAAATDNAHSLDSLLPDLMGKQVNLEMLTAMSNDLAGSVPDALHIENLPGCRNIVAGNREPN
ncbi:MAG: hypothetical protein QNJ11_12955 [Woeseiaceae bacterium]|nr:hypothetical protein [Woeseiaceae bacterium]